MCVCVCVCVCVYAIGPANPSTYFTSKARRQQGSSHATFLDVLTATLVQINFPATIDWLTGSVARMHEGVGGHACTHAWMHEIEPVSSNMHRHLLQSHRETQNPSESVTGQVRDSLPPSFPLPVEPARVFGSGTSGSRHSSCIQAPPITTMIINMKRRTGHRKGRGFIILNLNAT